MNVEQLETHKLLVRYKASVFNLRPNCNSKISFKIISPGSHGHSLVSVVRTKHNSSGEKLEFKGDEGLSKKTKTEHLSFKRIGTASQQARVDVLDRGMVLSFFQSMMEESDQKDNQEGQGSPEKFTPIQEARVDEKERVFHIIDNRSLQRYTAAKV